MIESPPLLELTDVTKRFGGTVALNAVSWTVRSGEIHCLVGENGSGKSTIIKLISGVHEPDEGGEIRIDGMPQSRITPKLAKRHGIQVIYQDLSLFPNLTVAENIAIDDLVGAGASAAPIKQMRARASKVLEGLGHDLPLDALVGSLSVAQRQMVAICRGLAADTRVLFMDEPTASLTRQEVDRLFKLVRGLQERGIAIVFVSHRLDEIVEIAERVSVLRDGNMVGTYPISEIDDHRLGELMTGAPIVPTVQARAIGESEPLLEVKGLCRQGEFENIDLTLLPGEVLGITGLLGAGRTELALALFGMVSADAGQVLLSGVALPLNNNNDAIRAGIAYVPEDRLTQGLVLPQSIADNIAITVLNRLADGRGFITNRSRNSLAQSWIEKLGVRTKDAHAPAHTLSGGNQQRIVLAKWLATEPKVLILDSPTVGVDIRNKEAIYEIVRELAHSGVSVLMISDEIPEVYFNSDRILHMRQGQIAGEFVPGRDSIDLVREAVYA
ncbi:sugar ABC transporter ATP-binding protein [bacterium]|nr:sugar ABC transporter ATP-binding protein [bacterium]